MSSRSQHLVGNSTGKDREPCGIYWSVRGGHFQNRAPNTPPNTLRRPDFLESFMRPREVNCLLEFRITAVLVAWPSLFPQV